MSILIKNMEMPKSCLLCPFVDREKGLYSCDITGQYPICDPNERSCECPLISVPDHGRLIDADALEELFREVIGNISKRDEIKPVLEHMVRASAMAVEMIKDAPTIIPAEEEP